MKIKVLLGSVGAVVILILVSFTNVVGVQSTTSGTASDSPLFSIRTQKATNKESSVLASEYLGKGIHALPFPMRDNRTELIQKVIERIRTMDERAFKRFVNDFVSHLNNNDKFNNIDKKQVVINLYRLRENIEKVQMFVDNPDRQITISTPYFCNIYDFITWIIMIPVFIIILLIAMVEQILPTSFGECSWRIAYCLE